jgi:hypothetical protein
MDFRKATDALVDCCRLSDVAAALDCSYSTVTQARMDMENPAFRTPPVDWQKALARVARRRAKELDRLAKQLEPPRG